MITPHARRRLLLSTVGALVLVLGAASAGAQPADTVRFTDIGNLRLSISNFGTIGSGFAGWPRVPSAEYPRSSGIEHLFIGGLWVGGIRDVGANRITSVSTGAVDISAVRDAAAGFELTVEPSARMRERSSDVESPFYSPSAVSQQDFLADFVDTNLTLPGTGRAQQIPGHEYPLGLAVHMESYAWSYPFADNFVILRYSIRNVSQTTIDSVHVGLWADAVVRNTQVIPPGGSAFFASGGNGFDDSLRMTYEWDASSGDGAADSYIAVKLLGATGLAATHYNNWQFRNSTGAAWTISPQDDIEKFARLSSTFLGADLAAVRPQLALPSNRSMMNSASVAGSLGPGDSIEAVFAVITAKKPGPTQTDEKTQRRLLEAAAGWAQRAYNGTDQNGNGRLDTNEIDLRGNGEITRYVLPAPPRSPRIRVVPESQRITVYWNDASESSVDVLTNRRNFEGYRIYRSNPGDDLDGVVDSLALVAELDIVDEVGLNSGLERARILDDRGRPKSVTLPGDTASYRYRLVLDSLLNGWQYVVAVTAFSSEDDEAGIPSLESSRIVGSRRAVPGTPPAAGREIGVYPNPYYVSALWDGQGERLRKIYFYNLPARSKVTIISPAGDVVATLDHDAATYNGDDLRWFRTLADGTQQLAGGEHAWDLITGGDQALATGIYLFSVEDLDTGERSTGRFAILK
jgi:hypothetical protein